MHIDSLSFTHHFSYPHLSLRLCTEYIVGLNISTQHHLCMISFCLTPWFQRDRAPEEHRLVHKARIRSRVRDSYSRPHAKELPQELVAVIIATSQLPRTLPELRQFRVLGRRSPTTRLTVTPLQICIIICSASTLLLHFQRYPVPLCLSVSVCFPRHPPFGSRAEIVLGSPGTVCSAS